MPDNGLVALELVVRWGEPYTRCGRHYAPLAYADTVKTRQQMIVFKGLDGPHRGKLLVCTLAEWIAGYEPPEDDGATVARPQEPVFVPSARPAGKVTSGSGV